MYLDDWNKQKQNRCQRYFQPLCPDQLRGMLSQTYREKLYFSLSCCVCVRLRSPWHKGMVPESVSHNFFLSEVQIAKTGLMQAMLYCIFLFFSLFLYLWIQCFHLIHSHSQEQVKVLALHWQNILGAFCSKTVQWWQICAPFFQFRLKFGQAMKGTII